MKNERWRRAPESLRRDLDQEERTGSTDNNKSYDNKDSNSGDDSNPNSSGTPSGPAGESEDPENAAQITQAHARPNTMAYTGEGLAERALRRMNKEAQRAAAARQQRRQGSD